MNNFGFRIFDFGISPLVRYGVSISFTETTHLCGSREGAGGEYMNNFGFRIFDFGISLLVRYSASISFTEATHLCGIREGVGGEYMNIMYYPRCNYFFHT